MRGTAVRARGWRVQTKAKLPMVLRRETAHLHRQVENDVGLPAAVTSRTDYVALLTRLYGFHAMVEALWRSSEWEEEWASLDVDLPRHCRTSQLTGDLAMLGADVTPPQAPRLELLSFGEALGSLYVVEGSSLGGQMLAPQLRDAVGEVPTTFFDSAGRHHPTPWRAVKAALRTFGERTQNPVPVVAGANATFRAFGAYVARATWSTAP